MVCERRRSGEGDGGDGFNQKKKHVHYQDYKKQWNEVPVEGYFQSFASLSCSLHVVRL